MERRMLTILVLTAIAWIWGPRPFFLDPVYWSDETSEVADSGVTWGQVAHAKSPRIRFIDFREQLIEGELKRPTTLYTNAREQVKFEQLLTLKRSFIGELMQTSKDRVFR